MSETIRNNSVQLKLRLLSILLCLSIVVQHDVAAQETERFSVLISPLGFKFQSVAFEELGLGYYEVNFIPVNQMSVLGLYRLPVTKKFGLNLGLGLRQDKFNFDYIITHPFDTETVLDKVNRYFKRVNLTSHVSIGWNFGKVKVALGYEFPIELFNSSNINYYYGSVEIFIDPAAQDIAYFRVVERNVFTDDFFRLASPVLLLEYKLGEAVWFSMTSQIKPYGSWYLYQLDIQGDPGDLPDGDYQLNDSRLNMNNISISLGVAYVF